MKALSVLAVACLLFAGASTHLAGLSAQRASAAGFPHITHLLPVGAFFKHQTMTGLKKLSLPAQTSSTSTTPTDTPTPSPTPTVGPTYPDAVTLLAQTGQVYLSIRTAHVELITVAEKPNVAKLTIDGNADATCSGPALKMTVNATSLLEGTSQTAKTKAYFRQIKTKTWRKSSAKKAKWKIVKNAENVAFYGFPFPIDNPLVCSTSGSGSSGGTGSTSTDVFVDAKNLGPDTFKGNPVWHVTETDVRTLSDGTTINLGLDFLIGQAHFTPYVISQTFNDTADGILVTEKQITTKIGEKVKVPKP